MSGSRRAGLCSTWTSNLENAFSASADILGVVVATAPDSLMIMRPHHSTLVDRNRPNPSLLNCTPDHLRLVLLALYYNYPTTILRLPPLPPRHCNQYLACRYVLCFFRDVRESCPVCPQFLRYGPSVNCPIITPTYSITIRGPSPTKCSNRMLPSPA